MIFLTERQILTKLGALCLMFCYFSSILIVDCHDSAVIGTAVKSLPVQVSSMLPVR
jgi:hypothetical protein